MAPCTKLVKAGEGAHSGSALWHGSPNTKHGVTRPLHGLAGRGQAEAVSKKGD